MMVRVNRDPASEAVASVERALFRSLYPKLRRFAAIVGPGSDPDDLVQEALARTLRQTSLGELADASAYLQRAILNLALDRERRRRRWVARKHLVATEDSYVQAAGSDIADLLLLSVEERAVIFLVDVEGYGFAEAASMLGCSEATARKRASRGRRRLSDELKGEL